VKLRNNPRLQGKGIDLKQSLATIIANSEVMPGVHLVWLEPPPIASSAQPGQFIMVRCGEETLLRRPLSIHQVDKTKLALLFSVVGKGTHWLSQRKVGDNIDLLGPLGNGYTIYPDSHNLLLVAGGIGIASLYFPAQEALNQECSVTLLLGARTLAQLYPEPLLPSGIKLATATDDGTGGEKGPVIKLLPNYIDWADQVFACGPRTMYRDMADKYPQLKDKPVQISLEMRMGCGLGVCYGCTVKTKNGLKQVCQDGPVFNLPDIPEEELSPI
jgi:dihydroorotate dehydrogenase electron transfer subunit